MERNGKRDFEFHSNGTRIIRQLLILLIFLSNFLSNEGEQRDSRLFLMGAGTNVGEHTDGERDGHRRGRPKSSRGHEQQRFVGSCPRPGQATANVYAGADQLKRGVTPLEEAQMSQRLLRPFTLLTQQTHVTAHGHEERKLKRESERERSIGVTHGHGWTRNAWIGEER